MAFNEALKLQVKKQTHFCCCLCKSVGVEIHHVIPESEGGPDDMDNAAPLCPSCHEIYGANPTKRKFIKEARDFWYELCEKRFSAQDGLLENLINKIDNSVTKEEFHSFKREFIRSIEKSNNKNDNSNKWEVGVETILSVLMDIDYQFESSALDLLFDDIAWAEDDLPELKEYTFRRFGEVGAECFCKYVMYTSGIDLNILFKAEEFGQVYSGLVTWVCIMYCLDLNEIEAVQSGENEFMFRINKE